MNATNPATALPAGLSSPRWSTGCAAGCVFAEDEAAALAQSARDPQRLERLTRRQEAGEPLEQLLGWVDFAGLRLAVGPHVFVPRQRSLLLAQIATRIAQEVGRCMSPRWGNTAATNGLFDGETAVARCAATVRTSHPLHKLDWAS